MPTEFATAVWLREIGIREQNDLAGRSVKLIEA